MLFDDVNRESTDAAGYSEPHLEYLSRSARPEAEAIRSVLEEWFARYPVEHQNDFRNRFLAGDIQFRACVFELYVFELLRACGYKVQVHPASANEKETKPDFLARRDGADVAYVECTTAAEGSREETGGSARERVVYDTLDRLDSPDFFLDLQLRGTPSTPVPGARLRRRIASWLRSLDYEEMAGVYCEVGIAALPVLVFEHDGWRIEVRPIPKSSSLQGQPGFRPIGAKSTVHSQISRRDAVRAAVMAKGSRYGSLNAPYLVAVNCLGRFAREGDFLEALYGDAQERYNGVWLTARGKRYTRVSGVVGVLNLDPWQFARRDACLYHNPHAHSPYLGPLTRLRQCRIVSESAQFTDGVSPRTMLGLSAQWPECGAGPTNP